MPVPNRTKKSMAIAFKKFMGSFDLAVKSMTVAHGKEFLGYRAFQKLYGLSVYFWHPYCPEERGSNEHFSGKLRCFF